MASGIGEAASVLTLIKGAAILAGATRELARRIKNAPEELHAVAAQLMIVQSELELVKHTSDHAQRLLFTDDLRKEVNNTIVQARNAVSSIDEVSTKANGNEKFRDRISRAPTVVLDSIDEVKALITKAGDGPEAEAATETQTSGAVTQKLIQPRRLLWEPWSFGSNWAAIGVNGSLVPTGQGSWKDYSLAVQFCLPLARVATSYALLMSVTVRTFPLCPRKFKFLQGGNITIARMVDDHHPFMEACESGDIEAVRVMLRTRQGSPSDIVARNWNPMSFAILGGSVEVVEELLAHGADVDGTFGQLQTTPLQWAIWQRQYDITRTLLNHGASQDHINTIGWNTTFFCWPSVEPREQEMLDFLNLLNEYSYQDLAIEDTEGWTALHRVAAYATPSEVVRLIQLGADPEKAALPLKWNAIHHAVFYGNYATFVALLPYYADKSAVSVIDGRGWTLLHIAASAGHENIVRHLLHLGADPMALTYRFPTHMPESITNRACTVREVAAAQSVDREWQYLETLRSVQGIAGFVEDADVEDDEQAFWDASESV